MSVTKLDVTKQIRAYLKNFNGNPVSPVDKHKPKKPKKSKPYSKKPSPLDYYYTAEDDFIL